MKSLSATRLPLLLLCLLVLAANASAQEQPAEGSGLNAPFYSGLPADKSLVTLPGVESGSQIRIHTTAGARSGVEKGSSVEGRFQSLENGVLIIKVGSMGTLKEYPVEQINRLEVRTGNTGTAWAGALGGVLVGGILAAATQPDRSNDGEFLGGLSHMEEDMARGTAMVVGGTIIGALIGLAVDPGQWKNVSLQHELFGLMGQTG